MITLGLDIGSNSVGSAWIDRNSGQVTTGASIFPAGVDESDDKRGDPKNAKRRMVRRSRITLARRAHRKRELRLRLIAEGLLPQDEVAFKQLLENTDPWSLRCKGLDDRLTPHEFGRVLLHLAQRRGALGLKIANAEEGEEAKDGDDGKVKAAISEVRANMRERQARTFGEFMAMLHSEQVTKIATDDKRPPKQRKGPREYRDAIRNKAGSYERCADRNMIRDEFARLWDKQAELGGPTAGLLSKELRAALDDESGDSIWRHRGLLFGQRRATWDLGTLGRCVLEPTERCVPHADRHASRYRVIETVNNLKIIERGKPERPLWSEERDKIIAYLSGPLGMETKGKRKGQPKQSVSVTDLRNFMGSKRDGWGPATKKSNPRFRFNIENDPDRKINTDWFSREIIHGAVTLEAWNSLSENVKEGLNRAILKYDPDEDGHAEKLKTGVMKWAALSETQAAAIVSAWKARPRPDAKRLNMSRRAVQNLLPFMDQFDTAKNRWFMQQDARKAYAKVLPERHEQTGQSADELAARRYETGAKGATARDRYYMKQEKHFLKDEKGQVVFDDEGQPLAEPPPAPLVGNPVVRKAIHEVRRHLVEYMKTFGRKPDQVYVELAREARMGKMDADRLLFRNRLRNRIRNDIIREFDLESQSATQQRAAVNRVILCVQQNRVCPLCGNQAVPTAITPRMAANGEGVEVAHIIPRASGGHNGLSNIVLAHTKCNRDMGRQTPRQFWSNGPGFDQGMTWVEGIYGDIERPKFSEVKNATGESLWLCYFTKRDDAAKVAQFKKDITDIQQMTPRQEAATKYAARQVMAYLADALFDGKGLPERSSASGDDEDKRKVFATDGMWTSRLRREWGLFFDPHDKKAKGLDADEEHVRKEKDRGDHRHHAIDAVVIANCTHPIRNTWDKREKKGDAEYWKHVQSHNSIASYDDWMESYRRQNPLDPPKPFRNREEFREAVRQAVYGSNHTPKPVCHRPVKRKLIGAFHEETLFGPVLDNTGNLTENFTAKKSVIALDPNHLRMPRPETEKEAIARLAARRQRECNVDEKIARKWARSVVSSPGYEPAIIDPPPGKSGLVRDIALRGRLRQCLADADLDPDNFTANQIKKLVEADGVRQTSGVPIRSVVLLRTMSDPVVVKRKKLDYATGEMVPNDDPASMRAYVGGNNHHIEIRVDAKGNWSGEVVTAFEAAQRKITRLRALRNAEIPKPEAFRKLSQAARASISPLLRSIEEAHPIVDRRDDDAKGGRFVMSLCEGETLLMKRKQTGIQTGEVGYFIVAKLDKPRSIVLVPHWDARAATARKNADGEKVPNSKRTQFSVTPSDLKTLAPPGHEHAVKVRVSPLGCIKTLVRD